MGARDRAQWERLRERWAQMLADPEPDGWLVAQVLDEWSARHRGPALAWVEAEIAAGRGPRAWTAFEWLELLVDRDDLDPRARLVDAIHEDHAEWSSAQVTRLLRFAPQVVTLCLQECWLADGLESLFPPGVAWTRLRELYLEDDEGGLADALIDRIVTAPWLGQLEVLRLDTCEPPDVDRLAAAAMSRVQTLELGIEGGVTAAQVAALLDPVARPRLAALTLSRTEPPTDAPVRAGVVVTYAS